MRACASSASAKRKPGVHKKARPTALFFAAAALALAADQVTKWAAFANLPDSWDVSIVPGVFYLVRAGNTGVVWGLLGGWPQAVLLVGWAAAVLVAVYFFLFAAGSRLEAAALGAILGGAVGNLFDRAAFGYVRDFLDFRIREWHWPTFNVADACITVGAGLLVWLFLFRTQPKEG